MMSRRQQFVADDFWLLIAVVTLALTSLAGVTGLEALAGAITIVGWFLLTPIFLFWGEEVALLLFDEEATEPTHDTEPDALDELKRRYANGEIDDDEFERRLERLVAVEDLPDDVFTATSTDEDRPARARDDTGRVARGKSDANTSVGSPADESVEEGTYGREREQERER